eukprot:TRINITY_DN33585_c0_g1_i1.p1 TRINITY_DN33585_c0_g1~~TRINITY_DN33585_c0_g1_i1.p1  ORF type:complete len:505 (+),score=71.53 TRINITY_DN33585_c0_g1_i1:35-1549(+)
MPQCDGGSGSDCDSDGSGDSETKLLPARPHENRCWLKVSLGLVVCLLVAAVVGALCMQPIGRYFAAQGIRTASVHFGAINVGSIGSHPRLSPHIVGRVSRPSPVPAEFKAASLVIKVPSSTNEGLTAVGKVFMPSLYVNAFQDLELDLTVELSIESMEAFGLAGQHAVLATDSFWVIEGKVSVECWLLGISLIVSDIDFSKSIILKGMGGFSQLANPITMNAITHASGLPDVLHTTVSINMYNPSYMAAHIDAAMQFQISQRGHSFGTAFVQNITVTPGRNVLSLKFLLESTTSNQEAIRQFILGYIRADVQNVTMHDGTSINPFVRIVLRGLSLSFNFQPPRERFIKRINANVGLLAMQATALVSNPLPQDIIMGKLDLSIREHTTQGEEVFRLDTAKSSTGIAGQVLKANNETELHLSLSTLDARLTDPALLARLIQDAAEGAIVVGVRGPITITIAPSFNVTVVYSANNVTSSLTCPVVCGSAQSVLNPLTWLGSSTYMPS